MRNIALVVCAEPGVPKGEELVLRSMADLCENATEEDVEDPTMQLQNTLLLLCTTARGLPDESA